MTKLGNAEQLGVKAKGGQDNVSKRLSILISNPFMYCIFTHPSSKELKIAYLVDYHPPHYFSLTTAL